jgi:hypothetical protein
MCALCGLRPLPHYGVCAVWLMASPALRCEVHWCLRPHPQWDVWFMSVHCLPRTPTDPFSCFTNGCWHSVLASAPFPSNHFSNAAPGPPIWSIYSASLANFNNLFLIRWKLSTVLTRAPLRQSESYSFVFQILTGQLWERRRGERLKLTWIVEEMTAGHHRCVLPYKQC